MAKRPAKRKSSNRASGSEHDQEVASETQHVETEKVSKMADNETGDIPSVMDFSQDIASAEAPPPLPAADYPATITGAKVRKSENSGNHYVEVAFNIDVDDFPPDYDKDFAPEGKSIYYRRVPWEDNAVARHRIRKFCEAISAPMSKKMDVNTWVGLRTQVTVEHSEYEGVDREEIVRVSMA